MFIKICGLRREKDVEYVNELRPDYVGFVFAKGRKRTVTDDEAAGLKAMLADDIKAVGVFVDDDVERVSSLLENGIIDVAQLHGDEDETYIRELRKMTNKPIIKAFQIGENTDMNEIKDSSADIVLLDSGQGSGRELNLKHIAGIDRSYILAGGLSPDNVAEVISRAPDGIIGVDVSSGVETDGFKDHEKIRLFMERGK
ncbi:MAG: phosphoribosylanthranilate isomerase [Lachnospiraceae bacterium]|nr:phosphoribosylanthranilate isomerase [Lachnospiraceae bacterium]